MILFNYDVLARPHKDLGSRPPDPEGVYMWRALHESSVGRIGIIYSGVLDDTYTLEAWLKINNIKASMYEVTGTTEPKLCAEKVQIIAATTGGRFMYFDSNPDTVAHTFSMGIPSFLVCQPYVVRPEWSTTKTIKGWDSLVEEIDKQALARSERDWGEFE
jgi:hypothetical protein